jgi:hypothetical protein
MWFPIPGTPVCPAHRIELGWLRVGESAWLLQKSAATSSPRADRFTSALSIGCLCICLTALTLSLILDFQLPPSEWATVLQRVEQGEPLRRIARGDARVI